MLTDLEICQALQAQYDGEQFDVTIDISGVYVSVKHYPDCSLVMFRGSTTPIDFWRDFQGLMVQDDELGGVEQGFIAGIRDAKAHIVSLIPAYKKQVIAGHSLGAAHAYLYGGLAKIDNEDIAAIVTFGSPRPGGQKLKDILAPVTIRSYKNKGDPVTYVPIDLEPFEPYCEPRDFIMLDVLPETNDPWGPVAPHHLQLYQKGLS